MEQTASKKSTGETNAPVKRAGDTTQEPSSKKKRLVPELAATVQTKGFHAERQGEREDMQDACRIINDFKPNVAHLDKSIKILAYYGVFDGHAGAKAARYCAENLHKNIADAFPKGDKTAIEQQIKRCIVDAFKLTDKAFLNQAAKQKPSWKDGTTVTTLLVMNSTLYISNLGDSKAMLCRYCKNLKKHVAVPLTKNHDPNQFDERKRIQKAGGHVKDGRVMGVLDVSRSIGDGPYKNHGMTSVPNVMRCQLTHEDKYVLIACDGLWKSFSNEKAINFINGELGITDDAGERIDWGEKEADAKYESACRKLANEAVMRLSADNVTVLIVAINRSDADDDDRQKTS